MNTKLVVLTTILLIGGYGLLLVPGQANSNSPSGEVKATPTGDYDESPFSFHPASIYRPGYPDKGFVDAQNIGVRWAREGLYAYGFLIPPDLNKQVY